MAIIAIAGNNGVGKDTVAGIIQYYTAITPFTMSLEEFLTTHSDFQNCSFKHKKFATKVDNCFKEITGFSYTNSPRADKEVYRKTFIEFAESCKKVFGESIWAKSLMWNYYPTWVNEDKLVPIYPNWVISDLRFPIEYKELGDKNCIFIKILGGTEGCYLTDEFFDYTLENKSTIEDLVNQVKNILNENGYRTNE